MRQCGDTENKYEIQVLSVKFYLYSLFVQERRLGQQTMEHHLFLSSQPSRQPLWAYYCLTIAAFTNYLPLLGGVLPELLANDAHRLVAPAPWPLKVPVLRLPGPGGAVARGAWQQPGRLRLRHQALHLGVRAVAEAGHLAAHQRPIRLDELLEDEHVLVVERLKIWHY